MTSYAAVPDVPGSDGHKRGATTPSSFASSLKASMHGVEWAATRRDAMRRLSVRGDEAELEGGAPGGRAASG